MFARWNKCVLSLDLKTVSDGLSTLASRAEAHVPPYKYPFPRGDLYPHLLHGSLDPIQLAPKRHLDQFSSFCTAHPYAQHTDTQTNETDTHRPRYVRHLPLHCSAGGISGGQVIVRGALHCSAGGMSGVQNTRCRRLIGIGECLEQMRWQCQQWRQHQWHLPLSLVGNQWRRATTIRHISFSVRELLDEHTANLRPAWGLIYKKIFRTNLGKTSDKVWLRKIVRKT